MKIACFCDYFSLNNNKKTKSVGHYNFISFYPVIPVFN